MTINSIVYAGDNSHVVEVAGLVDGDGNAQVDATVTLVSIADARSHAVVTGLSFPVFLVHIGAGLYRAILPPTAAFVAGRLYSADITAVGSQGYHAEWAERLICKTRAA